VGQRSVDQVGEHGLDDGVAAVGEVGGHGRLGAVGEERMVAPDREQFLGAVSDPAHHQACGDRVLGGGERGEGGLGDLGVGDQLAGVRVEHRRSEGFVCGRPDIDETIRRLRAYAEAGADCLYAPRIDRLDHVAAIVSAVSPKPVNLLINAPFTTVAEAAQLGVRRISVGGTLARTVWGGFMQAATEIADVGTFSRFEQLPNVDALFTP